MAKGMDYARARSENLARVRGTHYEPSPGAVKEAERIKEKKKRERELMAQGIVPSHLKPRKVDPISNARVFTDEEKAAFLASRPDLNRG